MALVQEQHGEVPDPVAVRRAAQHATPHGREVAAGDAGPAPLTGPLAAEPRGHVPLSSLLFQRLTYTFSTRCSPLTGAFPVVDLVWIGSREFRSDAMSDRYQEHRTSPELGRKIPPSLECRLLGEREGYVCL